ncbi:MAG: hypothetical protein WCB53_02615 [Terriglobales bacterium]
MRYPVASRKRCLEMVARVGAVLLAFSALTLPTMVEAQGPPLTTISDTIYRADGTPASGTVLISWPTFQTATGNVVAAGGQSISIGVGGAFVAQLTPNVGATPSGTYYVAVFQLDDGTVRTQYWSVPTTSPVTISAVLTTPGTGLANTVATEAYVNQAVANVGAGSYVSISGATMTGPLTLPAATLISLVLSLLQSILASAKVGGAAADVIANLEGAVTSLLAVQGTPVTFAQLEGLRVTTKW